MDPTAEGVMVTVGAFAAACKEVAFAYDNVRFFRRHMEQAGLRPSDIVTPDDFRRIPPTTKVHYRKNFPAGVIAQGKSLKGRFVYQSTSSGTGGERLITVTHTYVLAQRMNHTISVHPQITEFLASMSERRTCRYAAPNCSDVECATPNSTPADRTLADGTLVLPVYHDLLATSRGLIDQAIEELTWYKPHWLYIDPTHLAFLIRHMRARDSSPPPVGALAFTYSQCTAVARRQIEAFFPPGVPMADVVSMSELGWVAMECPQRTHHVNTTSFYVELLAGDRPAEPGELAELVITSLGDRLSPHIRYRTGDYYRLIDGACGCGHEHVATRHEGRARDFLLRDGQVKLTPRGLDDLVGPAPWMDLYKMHQVDNDHFIFRYIPNQRFTPDDETRVAEAMRRALGNDVSLRMEGTDYISGNRSGKFACCVSEVSSRAAEDGASSGLSVFTRRDT